LTVRLFREDPSTLARYQERWRYIMIDEYQDTNRAQYELVRSLAARHRNLCVVGDDNQSIYGFRGADIRNILDFEADYPDCRVIKLEQNYRSTGHILEAANALIRYNLSRTEKRLWTEREPGPPLMVYGAEDEREEALFVAAEIRRLAAEERRPWSHFALLYRTNAQSRSFEEAFLQAGIPYAIVGGLRFFERREIKDLLAYLRVLYNEYDAVSLRRIANVPRRGIGEATLARLEELAAQRRVSLFAALLLAGEDQALGGRATRALKELGTLLAELRAVAAELPVHLLAEQVLARTGYWQELEAERTEEALGRLENLKEFLAMAQRFVQRSPDPRLGPFLEEIALLTDIDTYDEQQDAVVLMTLHSAKGLEFPVVFLVGMEEGIFPHARAAWEFAELEEERRLCYVGITRAQDRLYLTYAANRTVYGGREPRLPSRFLEEIPRELRQEVVPPWRRLEAEAAADGRAKGVSSSGPASGGALSGAAAAPGERWRVGDRVRHHRWGLGTVVSVTEAGPDVTLAVAFPGQGVKKLLAGLAPLERVK
ncbi:MAG: 3'-5' exonuclease, partial [Bacillota bacterium]|nr:3'-5' exonuclease [Bacillota bacterium]